MDAQQLAVNRSITQEERIFCLTYMATGGVVVESYKRAFPDECFDYDEPVDEKTGEAALKIGAPQINGRGNRLLKQRHIRSYIAYMGEQASNPLQLAENILLEEMLVGTPVDRLNAAKQVIARDEKTNARMAIETWQRVMTEAGAEVRKPVKPGAQTVTVSMSDVIKGVASLHLPLAGKTSILHKAGFPFNRTNADAQLSDLQVMYLDRKERFLILHGGSGLGKSILGAAFVLLGLLMPGWKIAIVGATYELCWAEFQYVYDAFINLFGRGAAIRLASTHTAHNHDMEIKTLWGSSVKAYSLDRDDGQAMLGKEFELIVVGEGSKVDHETWSRKCLRALDRTIKQHGELFEVGRGIALTTPDGFEGMTSAIWDEIEEQTGNKPELRHYGECNWHESVFLYTANVLANPDYSREVYESRKRTLNADAFAEQYEGLRVTKFGLVIKEFQRARHVLARPAPGLLRELRIGIGIDTGKFFTAQMFGHARDGRMYGIDGVYSEEMSIAHNAKLVRDMVLEALAPAYGFIVPELDEPRQALWDDNKVGDLVDLWYIDSASQHKDDLIELLNIGLTWDKPELLSTLDQIRNFFLNDQLFLSEDQERLIWEITKYRWAKMTTTQGVGQSKQQQLPIKKDDHAIDASRFILIPLWEAGAAEFEPTPVTLEQAFERQRHWEIVGHLVARTQGESFDSVAEEFDSLHGLQAH